MSSTRSRKRHAPSPSTTTAAAVAAAGAASSADIVDELLLHSKSIRIDALASTVASGGVGNGGVALSSSTTTTWNRVCVSLLLFFCFYFCRSLSFCIVPLLFRCLLLVVFVLMCAMNRTKRDDEKIKRFRFLSRNRFFERNVFVALHGSRLQKRQRFVKRRVVAHACCIIPQPLRCASIACCTAVVFPTSLL